jgi:hypothetical protein
MSETIKDSIIDFLINSIKHYKPLYSEEQCLKVSLEIIKANFPKCLEKFVKGEEWKL